MGITSLQVCMDSSDDWLQGTVSEEGTDQTSSDHDILVACSGTLIERRLRPQHEQSLKCPRCESTHTKFCYYNNYSLSQPRYFCKTCRRYWTKGGTLRNIPVGGGCRKNKKVSTSSKKNNSNEKNNTNDSSNNNNYNNDNNNISVNHSPGSLLSSSSSLVQPSNNLNGLMSPSPSAFSCFNLNSHNNNIPSSADLHRSFIPEMPFASLSSNALGFLTSDTTNPIFILENNPTPINFMVENTLVSGGQDFMGLHGENFDGVNVINDGLMTTYNANLHGMTASSLDHHDMSMTSPAVNDNNAIMVESFQRMMMPYDQNHHQRLIIDDHVQEVEDVKPISTRMLPLEWHDYNNHLHHRNTNFTTEIKDHSFGHNLGGLGSWTSLMNGHGSSATNPLV